MITYTGIITLLIVGVTAISPFRGIISKKIEYGVYGDLINIPKAIFDLLKGDYNPRP